MNYKKIVKPLSRITLLVATSSIIFGIVRLFQGSDDWAEVEAFIITPICCIIFLFVLIPFLEKVNKHPKP
jgi:membrane protein YdbS with pleckstrin-like domain